jgi:hypothetical protein
VAPIKIAPTMTLMEYTVTPTAETLKRTKQSKSIQKYFGSLRDDNQTQVFTDIDNYNDYNLDNDQENYRMGKQPARRKHKCL